MLNTQLVRDRFGQYYKINTAKDKPAPKALKAECFNSEIQAARFVENLFVSTNFWNRILIATALNYKSPQNNLELYKQIFSLLHKGKIKVFKVKIPSYADHPPEKRTVLDRKNNKHTFASSTTLLVTNPKEVFIFSNIKEAAEYLKDISPDEESLKTLATELDLPKVQAVNDSGALLEQLATELASGELIVVVDSYSAPPKTEELLDAIGPGNKKAGLGPPKDEEPTYDISTIIESEYKVVLFDRGLSKFQDSGEEPVQANPTYIELSLTSSGIPYDQGAKLSCSPSNVDFFEDEKCTIPFDINKAIPKEKIASGGIVKLYLKSKNKGKFTLKLTPEKSSDGRFNIVKIAEEALACVELQLELFQHDVAAIAAIQVNPDTDPVSDYHAALEAKDLPDQIIVSDENKIKSGRLLHAQKDNNFGRARLLLRKPEADSFPADCEDYEIVVDGKHASGGLKVFDAEFDGNNVSLPLKVKVKDLTADKSYWVEGSSETDKLLDARLDVGLDRSNGGLAKTPKRNADWARFSVVKFNEINLDYTAPAGKPDAWDSANKRFFINLKTATDGRKITIKAKLGKPLKDIVVHFMLIEDKDNRTTANWGVDLPNDPAVHVWKWKDIDSAVKHLDKTDRKDLLHVSAKTDVNGEVSKEVMLSQLGGDKFYLAAYIEQDPHFAKYIHEHSTLGKRKPFMAKDEINVWRKFWYQEVKVSGITVAGFGNAADCYEDVKVVMEAAPVIVMPRTDADALNPKVIYPKHMLNYYLDTSTNTMKNNFANDVSDGLMVGDAKESDFFALAVSSDERPVMVPILNANGLWVADGDSATYSPPWTESGFPYDISTDKELLNPPLQGGSLYKAGTITAEDWDTTANGGLGAWVNRRPVPLSDTDLTLNPARNDPNEVRINKPALLTMATRTRFKINNLKVRGAISYLGTSYADGIVNSYTPNDVQDFINTINHELGHSFKQTAVVHPTGIPIHPHQYENQGSHCRYKNKSCLMYESGPQLAALNRYCPVCHPHVLVQDMTTV